MGEPLFSIITPTVLRSTLIRTCKSIDEQSFQDYEHVVTIDCATITPEQQHMLSTLEHPKRRFIYLNTMYNDFGNTPRNKAGESAMGTYLTYLDDDDYYINNTMQKIYDCLEREHKDNYPDFAVFGAHRFGGMFFAFPPAICHTVSCQYIHKKFINGKMVLWPTADAGYLSDGIFIEHLKSLTTPVKLTIVEPLVCVKEINSGKRP